MEINDDSIDVTTVVSVRVIDVEEECVLTLSDQEPEAGTPVTATLKDGDGGISGQMWQWARSPNGRTNWANIAGATNNTFTPDDTDEGDYILAMASYNDGEGSGKTAQKVSPRVADAPPVNSAPAFPSTEDGRREVAENSVGGMIVGDPVVANDFNSDLLTYSLSGTDADLFSIDSDTGQLRTKDVLDYDPEGTNEYTVTVNVHDGFNANYSPSTALDDTLEVTITVTRVAPWQPSPPSPPPSPPTALTFNDGDSASRSVEGYVLSGADVGDPVATSHVDNLDITYSLSGTDADLFTVDTNTGQINVGQDVLLMLGQTYRVNVKAEVSTGADAEIEVVIEVAPHRYDLNGNGSFEKE